MLNIIVETLVTSPLPHCFFSFNFFYLDETCVCLCLYVMSIASDSSETIKVIIIKLGTIIASDMRMHHMLIILTLTFIQGHRF